MPGKQARSNEPALTRAQSQLAAQILREEFDPSLNTHFASPERKHDLLEIVNAAFAAQSPPLPENYSFRKMEDWRANCVYRYKCRQAKKQPESWETDGRKRYRVNVQQQDDSTPPKQHGLTSGARLLIKKRSPKTPSNPRVSKHLDWPIEPQPEEQLSLATTPPMLYHLPAQPQQLQQAPALCFPQQVASIIAADGSHVVLGDTTNGANLYAETVLTLDDPCGGLYGLDAPTVADPVWMAGNDHAAMAREASSPMTQPPPGQISFTAVAASGGWC